MSGHFISFEGVDGCGKSTQLRLTAAWLRGYGLDVVETFEPGDTDLGMEIRRLLLSGTHLPVPESELLLFLAERTQHVRQVIQPALKRGAVVLCDRYSDSTRAYQLAGRALDADRLDAMLGFAELGCAPELTLWFDVPVGVALERMRMRVAGGEAATRLDTEKLAFHERVAEGFHSMADAQAARVRRVDAQGDIDAVQQQVRVLLAGLVA